MSWAPSSRAAALSSSLLVLSCGLACGAVTAGSTPSSPDSRPETPSPKGASDAAESGRVSVPGRDLPTSSPAEEGLDVEALRSLLDKARDTESDAVVILRNGRVVVDERFGRPAGTIHAMSATKSIVSLVVGMVIDDGLLSLETPVHEIYPEWAQGMKRDITVRHLLEHSSGLQANKTTEAIYQSPDFVQFALSADLVETPGEHVRYNNKAVNLLSGIVERATGEKLDDYARLRLFEPLGIHDWAWSRDDAGNPHGMGGLQIHPVDLAKLGQLVIQDGEWNDARILSSEWITISTQTASKAPGAEGLLWWFTGGEKRFVIDDELLGTWRDSGVKATFIHTVKPLVGQVMSKKQFFQGLQGVFGDPKLTEWHATTWKAGRPDARVVWGEVDGIAARGYLGQRLVILPNAQLVAVRMRRAPEDDAAREDRAKMFLEFDQMVHALVP